MIQGYGSHVHDLVLFFFSGVFVMKHHLFTGCFKAKASSRTALRRLLRVSKRSDLDNCCPLGTADQLLDWKLPIHKQLFHVFPRRTLHFLIWLPETYKIWETMKIHQILVATVVSYSLSPSMILFTALTLSPFRKRQRFTLHNFTNI